MAFNWTAVEPPEEPDYDDEDRPETHAPWCQCSGCKPEQAMDEADAL